MNIFGLDIPGFSRAEILITAILFILMALCFACLPVCFHDEKIDLEAEIKEVKEEINKI